MWTGAADAQPDSVRSDLHMAKPAVSRGTLLSTIVTFFTVLMVAYSLDGGAALTMTALQLRGGFAIILWLTSTYLQCSYHGRCGSATSSKTLFVLRVFINLGQITALFLMLCILEGMGVHGWRMVKQEVDGTENTRVFVCEPLRYDCLHYGTSGYRRMVLGGNIGIKVVNEAKLWKRRPRIHAAPAELLSDLLLDVVNDTLT